jgi:hypothetical protein
MFCTRIEKKEKAEKAKNTICSIRDCDPFEHQLCLINFIAGCLLDVIGDRGNGAGRKNVSLHVACGHVIFRVPISLFFFFFFFHQKI